MPHLPPPTRKASRQGYWILGVGLIIAVAAVSAALVYQSHKSPSPSAAPQAFAPTSSPNGPHSAQPSTPGETTPRSPHTGPLGEADGVVPDGVTVFDDTVPAVAKLDPALRKALRRAAKDAADDGVTFYVNSGWRSPAYQDQLLRQAVSKYGSEKAAARWVATAATSLHVKGEAVDVGHTDATMWLSKNGAKYGLCQIYRNEPWHYELRPKAIDQGCPPMYADPTQDPRLQQ